MCSTTFHFASLSLFLSLSFSQLFKLSSIFLLDVSFTWFVILSSPDAIITKTFQFYSQTQLTMPCFGLRTDFLTVLSEWLRAHINPWSHWLTWHYYCNYHLPVCLCWLVVFLCFSSLLYLLPARRACLRTCVRMCVRACILPTCKTCCACIILHASVRPNVLLVT